MDSGDDTYGDDITSGPVDAQRIAYTRMRMNEARKALHDASREGATTVEIQRLSREYSEAFDAFMGYAD